MKPWLCVLSVLLATVAESAVLTHGPIIGAVTPTAATVMLRTDTAATVAIRYTDDAAAGWLTSPAKTTLSGKDFTAKIRLSPLASDTRYFLKVMIDGVEINLPGTQPTFLTAPLNTEEIDYSVLILTDFRKRVKLVGRPEPEGYASAAAEGARWAFIGGDFDHRRSVTISQFREAYKDLYSDQTPGTFTFVQGILRTTPIVHQWDDHDLGVNDCNKTSCLRATGLRAYKEYVPHYLLANPSVSIWQRFRYGQAEFFVLDTRTQRDVPTDPDGPDKSMLDGNALGASGQLQWLLDGLAVSTAKWKIVFSSVVFNPTAKPADGWAPFQNERQKILNHIAANGITGVVFVSGDLHAGGIDDGSTSGVTEMVVPAIDLGDYDVPNSKGCLSGVLGVWSEGTYADMTGPCQGYGLLRFTLGQLELIVKDRFGAIRIAYQLTLE